MAKSRFCSPLQSASLPHRPGGEKGVWLVAREQSSHFWQPFSSTTLGNLILQSWPGGQMLAMQSYDGNFYWLHTDALGSGRKMTNESGTVIYRAEYDPH